MNGKLMEISLSQARVIAEQHARADLESLAGSSSQLLKIEFLESDYCWMFFISEEINVPQESMLGIKWAHVVSKKGTYSMVQDFSGDKKELQTYFQKLSNNFRDRGE